MLVSNALLATLLNLVLGSLDLNVLLDLQFQFEQSNPNYFLKAPQQMVLKLRFYIHSWLESGPKTCNDVKVVTRGANQFKSSKSSDEQNHCSLHVG